MHIFSCVYIATCQVTERLTGWVDIRKGCLEKQEGGQPDNGTVGLLHDSPLSSQTLRFQYSVVFLVHPLESKISTNYSHQFFQTEGEKEGKDHLVIEFLLCTRHWVSFSQQSWTNSNNNLYLTGNYYAPGSVIMASNVSAHLILTIVLWFTILFPGERIEGQGSDKITHEHIANQWWSLYTGLRLHSQNKYTVSKPENYSWRLKENLWSTSIFVPLWLPRQCCI